ncbi:hypothetical protein CRG98_034555 [Punica granatum]|uniref:Reverse transcriptase zinc-binding domain-containing protein n=1 Tax=Punica granatum TaxID=22663 RepID=A0A2I0IM19_PUNGR|nr:hypothetical protein CRG98_034555 [Punica granatum]
MEKLKVIQGQVSTTKTKEQEEKLLADLEENLIRKDLIWRQKSRELWLKEGDRNSKFFHLSTIIRRRSNNIAAIKDNNGDWCHDYDGIGNYFLRNFQDLFYTSHPSIPEDLEGLITPIITRTENESLICIPDDKEILLALKSIPNLKAPGPDGIPSLFYNYYGETVRPLLFSAVKNFFSSNHILKEWNNTFISLIPKCHGASTFKDFRPISLCNVHHLMFFNPKRWNIPLLTTLFEQDTVHNILKIHLSQADFEDSATWTPSSSGKHSVKSFYLTDQHNRFQDHSDIVWKAIWNLKIHERFKLHLLRIGSESLPWFSEVDAPCPLCQTSSDTLDHLYGDCIFYRVAWRESPWDLQSSILPSASVKDLINFVACPPSTLLPSFPPKVEFSLYASITIYLLWNSRNDVLHIGRPADLNVTIKKIKRSRMKKSHFKRKLKQPSLRSPLLEKMDRQRFGFEAMPYN